MVRHKTDRIRGAILVWVLPALAMVAAATVWWLTPGASTGSPRPTSASKPAAGPKPVAAAKSPANPSQPASRGQPRVQPADRSAIAKALAGEWSSYYQGQREMQVAPDGTGTMVSYPEGLAATFLAAKLTFQFRWTLNGDQLEFETVGGEPLDKVKVVVQMYGRRRSHKILKREAHEMVLLDEDGVTKYLWKRVAPKSNPKKE